MAETFRRATRMRALPRVAKIERKMFRAVMNIPTPAGVFMMTNVPFELFAIGVESHRLSFMLKKTSICVLMFGFFSCKTTGIPRKEVFQS